jgi:curved DNA-binding protein CbpA
VATEPDAYQILQVDPLAHDVIISAAYRALARLYHSDGTNPDGARMLAINRAFLQLGEPGRRRAYDTQRLTLRPVGPGRPGYDFSRQTTAPSPAGAGAAAVLDFGRYAGWRLEDLVRHDEDYVRWLARHSSGIRFRTAIKQLITHGDLDRPAQAVG